ncbi:MAG: hypothetical protein KatS3mg115_0409 [Candidatus Poribacteria bacterium]|nr:MAG: hypothetical protein KatS3mg115_0409 [Candidatus Poribacteria bacterium]
MVERWKGYLIAELEARNCGWVQNGRLTCPEGPLISPYRDRRYTGEERER